MGSSKSTQILRYFLALSSISNRLLKVGETSYKVFDDTTKWSCDEAGDYAKFSLPLETGDRVLVISFTRVSRTKVIFHYTMKIRLHCKNGSYFFQSKDQNGDFIQGSYEQYLNLTFAFDGVTYPADTSLPYSPNAKGSWSYTCNSQTIKV